MQTSQVACHVPPGGPSGATATAGRCDGTRLHEGKRLQARNGSAVNNARSGVLELRSLRPTRCAGFSPMQDQREGLKDIARCGHTVETYRGAQAAPGVGAAPDTSASTSTRPMSATVRRCISMPAPLIARALRASGLARRTALAAPHVAFGLCDSLATRNGLGADRRPTRSASTG